MKLLIISCVEEMQDCMKRLLNEAGTACMNVTSATSYRKGNQCAALSWFGRGSACEQANTLLMFSFTSDESAHRAIELIDNYNAEFPSHFAPRAYTLNVAESTHLCNEEE